MFYFSVVVLHLKNRSTVISVKLDLAATLFTPEISQVFRGHFTRPSISIVVSG